MSWNGLNNPDNSWWYYVGPYVGRPMIYSWTDPGGVNESLKLGVFHCPNANAADPAYSLPWINFKMNTKLRTSASTPFLPIKRMIINSPSRNLLLAEGRTHPEFSICDLSPVANGLWYPHGGKNGCLFADGHVEQRKYYDLKGDWSTIYNP